MFWHAVLVVLFGIGILVAVEFADGNLTWAEAFADRSLWRFLLAAQPVFAIGLGLGALAVEVARRRFFSGLVVATIAIWVSNAFSLAAVGFLVIFASGGF